MTAEELIQKVEAAGGTLELRGDRVHYRLPKSATPILAELKINRDEVLRILRRRLIAHVTPIPAGAVLRAPRFDGAGKPLPVVPRCWCCAKPWVLDRIQRSDPSPAYIKKTRSKPETVAWLKPGCGCLDAPQALACCGLCIDHCQCLKPFIKPENTVLESRQGAEPTK